MFTTINLNPQLKRRQDFTCRCKEEIKIFIGQIRNIIMDFYNEEQLPTVGGTVKSAVGSEFNVIEVIKTTTEQRGILTKCKAWRVQMKVEVTKIA